MKHKECLRDRIGKHVVFLTAIFLMSLPPISQAEIPVWWVKAKAWGKLSKKEKLVYASGVLDGLIFAVESEFKEQITYSTSHESYIKALDQLYEDYRNELIPAVWLFKVASMEMQGVDEEQVDKELRTLRAQFHGKEKERAQQEESGDGD